MTNSTTSAMDSTTAAGVPDQPAAPGREHRQITPPEDRYATELAFLAAHDTGPRPPGWRLTPRAVVTFVTGSAGRRWACRRAPGPVPGCRPAW